MDDTENRDVNLDGMVDVKQPAETVVTPSEYADSLATQLRKGYLAYCVLLLCAHEPKYTSEIIAGLQAAHLVVVEGTIYPLLGRLQKDNILGYEWRESEQGPPRKYYLLTEFGKEVVKELGHSIADLNKTLTVLEKGARR